MPNPQSYMFTISDTLIHNLKDLIVAADAALASPAGKDLLCEYTHLTLANASAAANYVFLGGPNVDGVTYMGLAMPQASQYQFPKNIKGKIYAQSLYLICTTQPVKVTMMGWI